MTKKTVPLHKKSYLVAGNIASGNNEEYFFNTMFTMHNLFKFTDVMTDFSTGKILTRLTKEWVECYNTKSTYQNFGRTYVIPRGPLVLDNYPMSHVNYRPIDNHLLLNQHNDVRYPNKVNGLIAFNTHKAVLPARLNYDLCLNNARMDRVPYTEFTGKTSHRSWASWEADLGTVTMSPQTFKMIQHYQKSLEVSTKSLKNHYFQSQPFMKKFSHLTGQEKDKLS